MKAEAPPTEETQIFDTKTSTEEEVFTRRQITE